MQKNTPQLPQKQATFRFDKQSELLDTDYILSDANSYAARIIQNWPAWEGNIALIYGPAKSGKSHLASIWQQHAHAAKLTSKELYRLSATEILQHHQQILIEDIRSIHDETVLFHLFNAVRAMKGASMLLTASEHPNRLGIRLPDLRSRLLSTQLAALELPDEALLRMVIAKHFSDHQLRVASEVIEFLAARCERSFAAVSALVETLDTLALSHKRNITIPFIKEVAPQLNLSL